MTARRYDVQRERLPMQAVFEARGSALALDAALRRAGMALPDRLHRSANAPEGARCFRLGPRRAIVLAPPAAENALDRRLSQAFVQEPEADYALVSDMLMTFWLTGAGAEDVLRQGAPLDLAAEVFPPGFGTGTELWGTTVILIREAAPDHSFLIIVERSFAGYIEDWLEVAAGGTSTQKPATMLRPPTSWQP
jgi:heterotetrameric sarcosine oxidase gamma subunit